MKRKVTEFAKQISIEGLMNFDLLKSGVRTMDFECCENVEQEPFLGTFRVQGMRNGNVYMTEIPPRIRNKAIFRDDNSSFSLGQNDKYYFYFSIPKEQLPEIPEKLVQQASNIAQKVLRQLILKK